MLNGETPLALEPCGAASRSARPRPRGYVAIGPRAVARRRRQPVAGPGRAGGKLGARPPGTSTHLRCDQASGRGAWSRFSFALPPRVLSRLDRVRLRLQLYRTTDIGLRRAYRGTPIAANASRREHEPRTYTARGTIFSHLCTQGVHRRLSTFEYARPRSAWISHDYIPPPAANTLQSR
jgi:hypothetical protein